MNLPVRLSGTMHARRVAARTIACGVLGVLPACHIPKLHLAEPGQSLPADFKGSTGPENTDQLAAVVGGLAAANVANDEASPENSALLGINEFFGDPALTRMIAQALAGNQELKILNQEIQIAGNEILARRGAYLPFVTTGLNGGVNRYSQYTLEGASRQDDPYLRNPDKFLPNGLPNTQVGLNIFWQLDIWRELRNARDAAQLRYVAATEKRNYFVTRLVADIAENYYQLMALDKRLEILTQTIELQQQSLKVAEANKAAARGTELGVQRFLAEVRRNQSEKLIVRQDIIEVENRINFLVGRYPQPVERTPVDFIDLNLQKLSVGLPAQILQNRPDVRQAERELAANGLDVKVARAHFFPRLDITGGVGFQAFNPAYLFTNPAQSLIASVEAGLVTPLINKKAIQAEYLSANARQLESVYNYQRVILNAFTEVVNRVSKVENYRKSIDIKKQQLDSLQASVEVASKLFQNARADYVDVLFAQRDLRDARIVVIETKQQQLSAVVNTYQALGGGYLLSSSTPEQAGLNAVGVPPSVNGTAGSTPTTLPEITNRPGTELLGMPTPPAVPAKP